MDSGGVFDAGGAGLVWTGWGIWRWADAVYYPLAATGVILLFLANNINREVDRLETASKPARKSFGESARTPDRTWTFPRSPPSCSRRVSDG